MDGDRVAITRPRVYVTDFETAVYFPPDVPLDKRTYAGRPAGSSFPADPKEYNRPSPPEVLTGEPYNPFKLDVWQFATSLSDFKVSLCALPFSLSLKRIPPEHCICHR